MKIQRLSRTWEILKMNIFVFIRASEKLVAFIYIRIYFFFSFVHCLPSVPPLSLSIRHCYLTRHKTKLIRKLVNCFALSVAPRVLLLRVFCLVLHCWCFGRLRWMRPHGWKQNGRCRICLASGNIKSASMAMLNNVGNPPSSLSFDITTILYGCHGWEGTSYIAIVAQNRSISLHLQRNIHIKMS